MMENTYWHKQTKDQPLFPDLLWSKPENKRLAGKMLIIGGNKFNFSAPAQAYEEAVKAGVGVAKVLMPDALKKTIGRVLENCEFAPTNKSGSFARSALDPWLEWAMWSDHVLLAGDVGRNSETAIVLEQFIQKYSGPLTITQDCLDQFTSNPEKLFSRPNTTIVASFAQLQKAWPHIIENGEEVIKYGLPLKINIELIHDISKKLPVSIVTKHNDELIVAVNGKVSTTPNTDTVWRVKTAASTSVWWLQNADQPFQALTMAAYEQSHAEHKWESFPD